MSQRIEDLTEDDKALLRQRLSDPLWRITNLYSVVDKRGNVVPFRPNPPQAEVLEDIFVRKIRRLSVLKARRIGFSTLFDIIIFDQTYWGENINASIVDQDQPAASEKLKTKCRFAYESLPLDLQEPLKMDNARELGFANGSSIVAGKKARGGTIHILHISEWGPIAYEDPERSEEIKTGALPAADQGIIFNESTFKGGKGGAFYDNLKQAMEVSTHLKTAKDFHFRFFGWYRDPTCTLEGDPSRVSAETHRYLDEKEKELGITFTPGQRLFYHVTKEEQGIFMFREYPTTPDEAFKAPVEGAIYGDVISSIRAQGRIIPFEWDRGAPIFSAWDIGWADSTSVWLAQLVGLDFHWIWHTRVERHTAAQVVTILNATGIPVAAHYLPHDAGAKKPGDGKNYRDALQDAGLVNLKVVPRTTNLWTGINDTRKRLAQSYFRLPYTEKGLEALEAYHKKDTSTGGTTADEPVHDWASHDSSALRTFVEAFELGMVNTVQARRTIKATEPRFPDGSMVIPDMVKQIRQGHRQDRVLSGPSL